MYNIVPVVNTILYTEKLVKRVDLTLSIRTTIKNTVMRKSIN